MHLPDSQLPALLADLTWSEVGPWLGIGSLLVIALVAFFIWPDRVLISSGFSVKREELETDFTRVEWVTIGNQLWENITAIKLRDDELLLKVASRKETYGLPLDHITEIDRAEWIEPLAAQQSQFRIKVDGREIPLDVGKEMNAKLSDALRARSKLRA